MNKDLYLTLFGGFLSGFSAGALVGIYVTEKRAKKEYEALAEAELEKAKKYYITINARKAAVKAKNEERAAVIEKFESEEPEEVEEIVEERPRTRPLPPPVPLITTAPVARDEPRTGPNLIDDPPRRRKMDPYLITQEDTYLYQLEGFSTERLTFFEEDGILVDNLNEPIPDIENVVGEEHLSQFGNGSKDNNVVYVRNERLSLDFEITRNKSSYEREILGVIEHSDRRKSKKFRKDE